MKDLSVGVIITDYKYVLGCIAYPNKYNYCDIPKGRQEAGETYLETVLRETNEETGVLLDHKKIIDLGMFTYTYKKDLYLFLYKIDYKLIDYPIERLKCTSYYVDEKTGKKKPEFIGFEFVPVEDILIKFYKSLGPIIEHIIEERDK
jgi:8-oxo-dGTP pyrophosphatase MutT (NUDIX family)